MKKHLRISLVLFITVTALAFASNFIRWDETSLEQGFYALPFVIGMFFQIPFFEVLTVWYTDTDNYVNYELLWTIIPFIAGIFYAALYYLIIVVTKKITYQ